MAKEIEVVFIKEKKGNFKLGQRKKVKPGYAVNYLFPYGFAVRLSAENERQINAVNQLAEKKQAETLAQAQEAHTALHNQDIAFSAKTHTGGKLYGSIGLSDILKKINISYDIQLDKFDIKGFTPIKEVGTLSVTVSLHPDVQTVLTVTVSSEKEEAAPPKGKTNATGKAAQISDGILTYADEVTPSTASAATTAAGAPSADPF